MKIPHVSRLTVPGFLVRSPEGVEVDVILGEYLWMDEALTHPRHDPRGILSWTFSILC